ncbi:MAG: hypothetical protein Q4G34_03205 [Micrococcus sp.]|nr:hypothetical protein [Micrococcus sp.]
MAEPHTPLPPRDPLDPLPPDAVASTEQGATVRATDRHGRGLRHPWPLTQRGRTTRQDALVTAVEAALERLGSLESPALRSVTVTIHRIPDHAEELLARLRRGDRPGPEQRWSHVERSERGAISVTLYERALLAAIEREDLDTAVYATLVARCAEISGCSPEDLDPRWGRLED